VRIVITGAAGYLGSCLWAYLKDRGYDVWGIDNLQGSKPPVVDPDRFFEKSFFDLAALNYIDGIEPDVIVHMAASTSPSESMKKPHEYWDNNVRGLENFLEICMRRRLVFSSTGAVYDPTTVGGFSEESAIGPENVYGKTKLAGEWLIEGFPRVEAVIFRYFNVAGAYRDKDGRWWGERRPEEAHLIPAVMDIVEKKRDKVTVHGGDFPTNDGSGVRDYIHVTDLARAHEKVIRNAPEMNGSNVARFNVGTGIGHSVLEVLKVSQNVLPVREIPVDIGPRREGDPHSLVAKPYKLMREMNWYPDRSLSNMLLDAWEYRKQEVRHENSI